MSVLRYPGGKSRAVKILSPLFPDDMEILYSPFFGGGSVELNLAQRDTVREVLANDKFSLLINFWEQAKTNNTALADLAEQQRLGLDKDTFLHFRKTINDPLTTDIDKAVKFYCINRCSFSGSTFSGGFSKESSEKRFTKSGVDRLRRVDLTKFSFSNLCAIDFLSSVDTSNPRAYIYADPPYLLETNNLYGVRGDLHESFDHDAFAQRIKSLPRWILSYNDSPRVRELYTGHRFTVPNWAYGMSSNKASNEVVILSNDIVV
jgi:DNA adenine methylase